MLKLNVLQLKKYGFYLEIKKYFVLPQITSSTRNLKNLKNMTLLNRYNERKKQLLSGGQKGHFKTFKALTSIGN